MPHFQSAQPVTTTPVHQRPLLPNPAAIFREPQYADGQPYAQDEGEGNLNDS